MPIDISTSSEHQQKQSGLGSSIVVLSLLLALAGVAIGVLALIRLNAVEDDLARVEESLDRLAQEVVANVSADDGTSMAIDQLQIQIDDLSSQVSRNGGGLWDVGDAIRCLDSNWDEYVAASNEDRGGTYFSDCADQLGESD